MGQTAEFRITATAKPSADCSLGSHELKKSDGTALDWTDKITVDKYEGDSTYYTLALKYTENRWVEEQHPVNLILSL